MAYLRVHSNPLLCLAVNLVKASSHCIVKEVVFSYEKNKPWRSPIMLVGSWNLDYVNFISAHNRSHVNARIQTFACLASFSFNINLKCLKLRNIFMETVQKYCAPSVHYLLARKYYYFCCRSLTKYDHRFLCCVTVIAHCL